MNKNICPYCNEMREVKHVHEKENISVRGENIIVKSSFIQCNTCKNSFDDPKSKFDVLDAAYREYRNKHNMLQPEAIKKWRIGLNLTQIELSRILGFGDVTISRYESGKLQENAHDKAMRLAMKPMNMLSLINENDRCISDKTKKQTVINILQNQLDLESSFESFFEFKFNTYQPNEYSGYKKLNLDKVFAAIMFFCGDLAIFKTKLNKLMFYADFKYFNEHGSSITGLQYVKLPYGPVPDHYDYYIATLLMEQKLTKAEENCGEKLLTCTKSDLSVFNDDELQTLIYIKKYFAKFTASKISDYSHNEKAYVLTADTAFIPYTLAENLSV